MINSPIINVIQKLLVFVITGLVFLNWSFLAYGADPFITTPSALLNDANCSLNPRQVKVPEGSTSRYYPSDECGTIFVGPPDEITSELAGSFSSISEQECKAIDELLDAADLVKSAKSKLVKDIVDNKITADKVTERQAQLRIAGKVASDALKDEYTVFGARFALALGQDWAGEIRKYQKENPDSQWNFLPLPTGAALMSFEEVVPVAELEYLGIYANDRKDPYIDYTVSGLSPITATSQLTNENAVPIFFPLARAVRSSNLNTVEFGGGALTAAVTLNKAGYCDYLRKATSNLASFLIPSLNWNLALKTFGSYSVKINRSYARVAFDSVVNERRGTYYASALAEKFFLERSADTIEVNINDDLRNSLSQSGIQGIEESFVQNILTDMANQFLQTATQSRGRPIELPAVANVEQYRTIKKTRRVCRRSGGFLGIGRRTRCFDQAYDVRVLQNTTQRQQRLDVLLQSFSGESETRIRSWIIIPWNSSLAPAE